MAWLMALTLMILSSASTSAVAPQPLPQSSIGKTFAAGSYIIDAGWMGSPASATQPKTVLEQYGLIYRLLVNEKIPVYWIIGNGKTGEVGSAPSLTNTTADLTNVSVYSPYTSTSLTTKSYYSGPFVIPAEFMTDARLTQILAAATAITGVRVDKAAATFTAPVFDKITYWPRATLDAQNGSIAQGFYTNAKIPASQYSYNWMAPSQLTGCEDIFVMPHADPTWAVHNNLLPWNDQGGYIWAGCHAASVLENIDSPSDADTNPNMNFLTTEGLLDFGAHADGSVPYLYGSLQDVKPWTSLTTPGTGTPTTAIADRSDPVMQFIGATETAHQNGSEQIYMPNPESKYPTMTGTSRWNSGVRFISWDPTQADVLAVPQKSPGVAGVDLYGRAFDDPSNGLVMYQGGHNINKGAVGDTPAQRAYFNFLLLGGIERAPEVEITSPPPPVVQSGGNVSLGANIATGKGSGPYTYTMESTCGGTFSTTTGTSTGGPINSTWTAPAVNVDTSCQVRVVVTDACGRQTFDAFATVVKPVADLSITKTASSAAVPTNSNTTYTLTVTNNGPATSNGVVVTDALPASLSYVSATPSSANVSGQVVTWNVGALAPGASTTLTVTAKANSPGIVQNTATVTASTPDPNTTNNTAYANTQVINSGISVTKVARPEIVPSTGGLVTYEFVVRNVGDNPVKEVLVTDNPGCTITRTGGDLNNDNLLDPPYATGIDREIWRYTCTRMVLPGLPPAAPNGTPDVTEPGAPALDGDPNTKQDVVTVTAKDSAGTLLTAKAWTTVTVSTPAIAVTKTLDPAGQAPAPGQDATFKVVVSNTGNVPLTNVDTTDIWAGTCDTTTIPNLPVGTGGSFSMMCTATVPAASSLARHRFDTPSTPDGTTYSQGTGWPSAWVEQESPTSATAGTIQVVPGPGGPQGYSSPNVLRIGSNKQYVERAIPTLPASGNVKLRFDFLRTALFNEKSDVLDVQACSATCSSIGTVSFSGTSADTKWSTFEGAVPSGTTKIRLIPLQDLSNDSEYVYIDNVELLAGQVNSVTATAKDPFGTTVTATATAPVSPSRPPLAITKTASTAGPLQTGSTFDYYVTVTNTGSVTQTGLAVSDTLPVGLERTGAVKAAKTAFTKSVSENFGTSGQSYDTGTGWASAWTENGETTDPTANGIKIDTGIGATAPSLLLDPNSGRSIQRSVNLGGLDTATFAFQCQRQAHNSTDDELRVYVGTQLIKSFPGATDAGCPTTGWGTTTVTINTSQLVTGQVVKIEMYGDKDFWVDNITIEGSAAAVSNIDAGNPPTLTSNPTTLGFYDLAPAQSVTFTIPVKVVGAPSDGFQFSNLAQATSTLQTKPVSASVITPYKLAPSFEIRKTAIETWVNGSGTVTYRVELKNTGNTTLTPVTVTDPSCTTPLVGPTGDLGTTPDGKLQIGEIWRYTCTRTVTTQSTPPDPDVVPNTASATMSDPYNVDLSKTASAEVRVIHPAINLTASPTPTAVLTGGTVSYTYTLTNTGDIPLTNPAVTAANCTPAVYASGDTDNDGMLDITETWTFTCTTGPLTTDQTNVAVTASGKDLIFATTVTNAKTVTVDVIDPRIAVVKTAEAPGVTAGDSIAVGYPNDVTYRYAVTNTGDVPLSAVTGVDNKCTPVNATLSSSAPNPVIGDTNGNAKLDPGETWSYACGPVHLRDATTNTVDFRGTYSVNGLTGAVTASDTAFVDVRKPGLLLTKVASTSRVRVGTTVTYTYQILNTGRTAFTMENLGVLTDDKCSPVTFSRWVTDRDPFQVLNSPIAPTGPGDPGTPGDMIEYTCTSTLTAAMVDEDDRVFNTATMGESTDSFGSKYTPDPANASVWVVNPEFTVTKVATATNHNGTQHTGTDIDGESGQPVTYTFSITHSLAPTGTLADKYNELSLAVTDPRCDAGTIAYVSGDGDGNALLNPGETHVYTCTLASLPYGDPTVNTVTVVGTVAERALNPDGTPLDPNDGLGPMTHTATATVRPFSVVVTVLKRGLHCDVGVPSCPMTIPGTQFTLYKGDPRDPATKPGVLLTANDPATFATAKLPVNADYWLVETKAPDGFQLLAQPVKFRLTKDALTLYPETASGLITANGSAFTITVTDVPAGELPKAGGDGVFINLAIGLLLVAGSGAYYVVTTRQRIAPRRGM